MELKFPAIPVMANDLVDTPFGVVRRPKVIGVDMSPVREDHIVVWIMRTQEIDVEHWVYPTLDQFLWELQFIIGGLRFSLYDFV
jgi:hypothetical protein